MLPRAMDQFGGMRIDSKTSGSELLLSVIAIRLAVLVLAGWSLSLLPRQNTDSLPACIPATRIEAPAPAKMVSPRVGDPALADMLLHD
ncbi:hypothetical protein [Bradyrhizobium sp.]|uniref:hypothetical protein n=1 Tax=Bradyrhizobium sp. TaxID=376 RepID=UPI0039E37AF2